jgi:signal transduction histidine kinase
MGRAKQEFAQSRPRANAPRGFLAVRSWLILARLKDTSTKPPDPPPAIVYRQRADLTFTHVGAGTEALTGASAARWRRQHDLWWRVLHEEDAETFRQHLQRCAQLPEGASAAYRLRHLQSGQVHQVLEFRRALRNRAAGRRAYEGVWFDLTGQAILQERLAAVAWKEALSPVTMGLTHDFNNALTGILSLSDFFLGQVDPQHPFHEGLQYIGQNTRLAAQLAHTLLRLHHEKPGHSEYRDLNTAAADAFTLLHRVVPKRIELAGQWHEAPLPVEVDPVGLQRVMVYLALNAAETILEKGRLHFQTAPDVSCSDPRYGCFIVTGSGAGLQAKPLEALWRSPALTAAVATPLGLYQAKRFAEEHRGLLTVKATEDSAIEFCLRLPLVEL